MSLRTVLDLNNQLEEVDATWSTWTKSEPLLHQFSSTRDIRRWRLDVGWQEERDIMLSIGRLSHHGEFGELAMVALMDLAIDAVAFAVNRRSYVHGPDAEAWLRCAANQLWIELRRYPWHAPRDGWILQGLARDVTRAMDREHNWSGTKRVWDGGNPLLLDDLSLISAHEDQQPDREFAEVYARAMELGVAREDLELLLELAVLADATQSRSSTNGGLLSQAACAAVAEQRNIGIWAVRKRALKTLTTLREHSAQLI